MASSQKAVTVHLGLPKTGTTSIQSVLRKNADRLAPSLCVLTPARKTVLNKLAAAAISFSLNPDAPTRARLNRLMDELRKMIEDAPGDFLISHENLAGASPGRETERNLFPSIGEIMSTLDARLEGFKIQYVLYTRPMKDWKRSMYAEVVKSDGYTGSLEDYLDETGGFSDWDGLKTIVREATSNPVHFLSMDSDVPANFSARPLLELAGVSKTLLATLENQIERHNSKLPYRALELIRRVNATDMNPNVRHRLVKIVQQNRDLFEDTLSV